MAAYQQTLIIGNVGRDPEMRYLQSGVAVVSFSVAVTEKWTDRNNNERKEKTTWYRVSAWRGLAETVNTYVKKGMQIMVVGSVEARGYLDSSGQPAASLELTARDIQFLSRADGQGGGGQQGNGQQGDYEDFRPPSNVDDIPF